LVTVISLKYIKLAVLHVYFICLVAFMFVHMVSGDTTCHAESPVVSTNSYPLAGTTYTQVQGMVFILDFCQRLVHFITFCMFSMIVER